MLIKNLLEKLFVTPCLLAFVLGFGGKALAQHMPGMDHTSAARPGSAPVVDIVRDPAAVPPPVGNRPPATVKVELTAMEVVGELDREAGTTYRYWTL